MLWRFRAARPNALMRGARGISAFGNFGGSITDSGLFFERPAAYYDPELNKCLRAFAILTRRSGYGAAPLLRRDAAQFNPELEINLGDENVQQVGVGGRTDYPLGATSALSQVGATSGLSSLGATTGLSPVGATTGLSSLGATAGYPLTYDYDFPIDYCFILFAKLAAGRNVW